MMCKTHKIPAFTQLKILWQKQTTHNKIKQMINTQYKAGYIHHMLSYKVHLMIWKNQDLRAT